MPSERPLMLWVVPGLNVVPLPGLLVVFRIPQVAQNVIAIVCDPPERTNVVGSVKWKLAPRMEVPCMCHCAAFALVGVTLVDVPATTMPSSSGRSAVTDDCEATAVACDPNATRRTSSDRRISVGRRRSSAPPALPAATHLP